MPVQKPPLGQCVYRDDAKAQDVEAAQRDAVRRPPAEPRRPRRTSLVNLGTP